MNDKINDRDSINKKNEENLELYLNLIRRVFERSKNKEQIEEDLQIIAVEIAYSHEYNDLLKYEDLLDSKLPNVNSLKNFVDSRLFDKYTYNGEYQYEVRKPYLKDTNNDESKAPKIPTPLRDIVKDIKPHTSVELSKIKFLEEKFLTPDNKKAMKKAKNYLGYGLALFAGIAIAATGVGAAIGIGIIGAGLALTVLSAGAGLGLTFCGTGIANEGYDKNYEAKDTVFSNKEKILTSDDSQEMSTINSSEDRKKKRP